MALQDPRKEKRYLIADTPENNESKLESKMFSLASQDAVADKANIKKGTQMWKYENDIHIGAVQYDINSSGIATAADNHFGDVNTENLVTGGLTATGTTTLAGANISGTTLMSNATVTGTTTLAGANISGTTLISDATVSGGLDVTGTSDLGITNISGDHTVSNGVSYNEFLGRKVMEEGFLLGGQDLGESGNTTNAIFSIGSLYVPGRDTLSTMKGIGFTSTGASFLSGTTGIGWGLYLASDGASKVFLNADTGNIECSGRAYTNGVTSSGSVSGSSITTNGACNSGTVTTGSINCGTVYCSDIQNTVPPTWVDIGGISYTKRNSIVYLKGSSTFEVFSTDLAVGSRPSEDLTLYANTSTGTCVITITSTGVVTKSNANLASYDCISFIAGN